MTEQPFRILVHPDGTVELPTMSGDVRFLTEPDPTEDNPKQIKRYLAAEMYSEQLERSVPVRIQITKAVWDELHDPGNRAAKPVNQAFLKNRT
ncbi:hypothetical protein ACJ41P_24580 [Azospirillum argentinense]|uniref:Uncharacterized protein n=1 Tax=Azospirillum argentinense TaxID=2970906 RepID=A0ABW8VCY2_9PROT